MRNKAIFLLVLLAAIAVCAAQSTLTNDSVIKMVKAGLGEDILPEIDVKSCFDHPKVVSGMRERFPTVKDLPWVSV